MAASTALAASNRDPRHSTQIPQHDEVVSIQMTAANSCRTIEDSGRPLSDREVFECSWQSMCGPKPKKITVIIVVVLSIWASFILGLNVYKQVWRKSKFKLIYIIGRNAPTFLRPLILDSKPVVPNQGAAIYCISMQLWPISICRGAAKQ